MSIIRTVFPKSPLPRAVPGVDVIALKAIAFKMQMLQCRMHLPPDVPDVSRDVSRTTMSCLELITSKNNGDVTKGKGAKNNVHCCSVCYDFSRYVITPSGWG